MTRAKRQRLTSMDYKLKGLEWDADRSGINIDNRPEWVELNALVTAYHMGERKCTARFEKEYRIAVIRVENIIVCGRGF